MNFARTAIIIRREYLNRVRKKSFLLITFLSPIFFAAICILPEIIIDHTREAEKKLALIDNSGIISELPSGETVKWTRCDGENPDSVKASLSERGFDALVYVEPCDSLCWDISATIYSYKPLGVGNTALIKKLLDSSLESHRASSYRIEGLENIIESVRTDTPVKSFIIEPDGTEKVSESAVYMVVSIALAMVIYLFITLFGGMVLSSVIEEKSSRVVEVIVSTVKSTELMFGKIIGVAFVAFTQFFLWVALTLAIIVLAGVFTGIDFLAAASVSDAPLVQPVPGGDMLAAVSSLPFAEIFVCFLLYFFFGYMLYASLFAAAGSAVESESDSQQFQTPITLPLLLGFFVAIYAFKAPDSALVAWGSMIPFTSPIVMLARLPFGVETGEIVLSLAILVVSFIICAWCSAKIYKVGILMFGKKTEWKDLWKWLKQN